MHCSSYSAPHFPEDDVLTVRSVLTVCIRMTVKAVWDTAARILFYYSFHSSQSNHLHCFLLLLMKQIMISSKRLYVNDVSPMLAAMDTKLHLIHLQVFKNLHF